MNSGRVRRLWVRARQDTSSGVDGTSSGGDAASGDDAARDDAARADDAACDRRGGGVRG